MRFFNTTGPCRAADHYMLAPEARIPDLLPYVQDGQYFVVHAPRQVGKSTAMIAFAQRLRDLGTVALYATIETSQGFESVEPAEALWISAIRHAASIQLEPSLAPPVAVTAEAAGARLRGLLRDWSRAVHPRPVTLLLDEADVVQGEPLISLLRQLRGGFLDRPRHFPASVALAFMGFLQRVVNGGGQVQREYAAGRGAVDLVVSYGPDRFVVELKRVFPGGRSAEAVLDAGVEQLSRYLEALDEDQGWLLVFDQRREHAWQERLWAEDREHRGRKLHLRGA